MLLVTLMQDALIQHQSYSIELNKSGRIFRLIVVDKECAPGDSVSIGVEIENLTESPFMVIDHEARLFTPVMETRRDYVYIDYGGIYEEELNLIPKLRIIPPGSKLSLQINLTLDSRYQNGRNYSLYLWASHFDFDEDLKYLSEGGHLGYVKPKSSGDIARIMGLRREFELGCVPIRVGQKKD